MQISSPKKLSKFDVRAICIDRKDRSGVRLDSNSFPVRGLPRQLTCIRCVNGPVSVESRRARHLGARGAITAVSTVSRISRLSRLRRIRRIRRIALSRVRDVFLRNDHLHASLDAFDPCEAANGSQVRITCKEHVSEEIRPDLIHRSSQAVRVFTSQSAFVLLHSSSHLIETILDTERVNRGQRCGQVSHTVAKLNDPDQPAGVRLNMALIDRAVCESLSEFFHQRPRPTHGFHLSDLESRCGVLRTRFWLRDDSARIGDQRRMSLGDRGVSQRTMHVGVLPDQKNGPINLARHGTV